MTEDCIDSSKTFHILQNRCVEHLDKSKIESYKLKNSLAKTETFHTMERFTDAKQIMG